MRPISQTTTQKLSHCPRDDATLYTSLELSQATWLVMSLSPGSEKMSKYSTLGGDGAALLGLLRRLQVRAEQIAGGPVENGVIQEAGRRLLGSPIAQSKWYRKPCGRSRVDRRATASAASEDRCDRR